MKISDLKFDAKNANLGTERGRKALATSLNKYGAGRSILVDKKGRVIAGNKTLKEALAAGHKNIVVVKTDGSQLVAVQRVDLDLNDSKARALALADNRVGELDLEWDLDVLKELGSSFDLSDFWNENELRKFMGSENEDAPEAKIDQAEELRVKWDTKRGQVWRIEKHRLMCGDSTSKDDVARLWGRSDPSTACLMSTDPPYGVSYGDVVSSRANQKVGGWCDIKNDDLDDDALYALLEGAFKLCSAPTAIVWYGFRRTDVFFRAIRDCGWAVNEQIVWVKNSLVFGRADYQWRHEQAIYAKRDGASRVDDRTQTTVWEINKPHDSQHPTQKPLEIFSIPIKNHVPVGGICYEPFSGSGSQICAAQLADRVCYGVEIEPKYVAVALQRLSDMGLKPRLTK